MPTIDAPNIPGPVANIRKPMAVLPANARDRRAHVPWATGCPCNGIDGQMPNDGEPLDLPPDQIPGELTRTRILLGHLAARYAF